MTFLLEGSHGPSGDRPARHARGYIWTLCEDTLVPPRVTNRLLQYDLVHTRSEKDEKVRRNSIIGKEGVIK